MALRGPEALQSLEEALRDVRREEDEVAKRLARSSEVVTKLRETEGELFRQLAAVRLDPATQGDLTGQLSRAELRARDMLARHNEELQGVENQLKAADKALGALNAQRAAALKSIETHRAALNGLRERVLPQLAADPDYARRKAEAEEADQVAAESIRKTEQAETDRETKGKPYRDDPLFMYLWDAKYGTGEYRAGNIARWLDGMVARLVGYQKARPNYAMLNEIPLRLREHADRQVELAEAAARDVAAIEEAAVDRAGGAAARAALAAAEAEVVAVDQQIIEAEDARDAVAQTQHTLAQGSDPTYSEAVADLATTLEREELHHLLAEARATQTGRDDTLVNQIDTARQRAAEEQRQTREHEDRLKVLANRRRELEDIAYEFKKSRYDDPRSTFGEDRLVGDALTDFLKGAITAGAYWEMWRRSQNWQGGGPSADTSRRSSGRNPWDGGGFNWPDNSFGGGSSPRRGGGGGFGIPSGGGFSRPRGGGGGFRTGGGMKSGGGFKTGGGF